MRVFCLLYQNPFSAHFWKVPKSDLNHSIARSYFGTSCKVGKTKYNIKRNKERKKQATYLARQTSSNHWIRSLWIGLCSLDLDIEWIHIIRHDESWKQKLLKDLQQSVWLQKKKKLPERVRMKRQKIWKVGKMTTRWVKVCVASEVVRKVKRLLWWNFWNWRRGRAYYDNCSSMIDVGEDCAPVLLFCEERWRNFLFWNKFRDVRWRKMGRW